MVVIDGGGGGMELTAPILVIHGGNGSLSWQGSLSMEVAVGWS